MELVDITEEPVRFFDFLPADWSEEIASKWDKYKRRSTVFVLEENKAVLGGGIVFSDVSPDLESYSNIARDWFDRGYLYFAYLYIAEDQRGRGLGRKWIQEVIKQYAGRSWWLTTDDQGLNQYYIKLGFEVKEEIKLATHTEWLLARRGPP